MSEIKSFAAFFRDNKYPIYVLVLFMFAYLVNQLNTFTLMVTNIPMANELQYGDRVCNAKPGDLYNNHSKECINDETLCDDSGSNSSSGCSWRYLGTGSEYQLLAGPLFMVMNSISGIPMGLVSELSNIKRVILLSACCLLWSVMTVLAGLATRYWHICLARIFLGIATAGCVPFCASLISDYFGLQHRGAALGFLNLGIFLGYSMTFLLLSVQRALGWRAVYYISGAPGILLALLILCTVREAERGATDRNAKKALDQMASLTKKFRQAAKCFLTPTLVLLCIAGAVRNGAGIVWAYNVVNFFDHYHPDANVEWWFSWIPLVFGSTGAFGGGYVSDKLLVSRGKSGRIILLIACLLLSAPFQAGLLFLPTPWCYVSHMFGCMIGEAWIGVCIAVLLEHVPVDLTASATGLYFFVLQMVGGVIPLLVTPLSRAPLNLRAALTICFPGLYCVSAVLFGVTLVFARREESGVDSKGEMGLNVDVETIDDIKKECNKSIEKCNDEDEKKESLLKPVVD